MRVYPKGNRRPIAYALQTLNEHDEALDLFNRSEM